MTYIVTPFYTDGTGGERPWGEPFTIGAGDLHDSQVGARDFVEHLLSGGQPDGSHPLGMRIVSADGEVVFTYIRPAPSEE